MYCYILCIHRIYVSSTTVSHIKLNPLSPRLFSLHLALLWLTTTPSVGIRPDPVAPLHLGCRSLPHRAPVTAAVASRGGGTDRIWLPRRFHPGHSPHLYSFIFFLLLVLRQIRICFQFVKKLLDKRLKMVGVGIVFIQPFTWNEILNKKYQGNRENVIMFYKVCTNPNLVHHHFFPKYVQIRI